MNARQLQYALLLAQKRNFSQTAEELGLSQPALSKQIRALEDELGVLLFDRNTQPLTLTPAGDRFVEEAQAFLHQEERLRRSMEGFKSGTKGRLILGISPFRCSYRIPSVLRRLRERFPGLQLILKETDSAHLHRGVAEGEFDLALMNLPVDETLLQVHLLDAEAVMLAVPKHLAHTLPTEQEGDRLPAVTLRDCVDLPFVTLGKQQELRRQFDSLCAADHIHPEIAAEVVGVLTAWSLARAGVGATLLPQGFVTDAPDDGSLCFFRLKHNAPSRQPAVVYRKDRPLSQYAQYFIALLSEET